MQLGLHPQRDLFTEIRSRPGAEHQKQYPAHQQSGPGMQPCHRLAKTFSHAMLRCIIARIRPSTAPGNAIPAHARHAVRAANTHSTAQQNTMKDSKVAVITASAGAIGNKMASRAAAVAESA